MSTAEAVVLWSTGAWVVLLESFEREARRRTYYEPRNGEFVAAALMRVSLSMPASIALCEGLRAIEASYRRYLRARAWVADAVAS